MWKKIITFSGIFAIFLVFFISLDDNDVQFELFLENSRPHIGAVYPMEMGIDGQGIKIAVIDTGVNFEHPDLLGIGGDGKILGGYDFIENDNFPQDTNGHGTQVAGIIAADGGKTGVAPKSKILAYRVSEDGEAVSSELIIKAIKQAITDEADIINISLGVDIIHDEIDNAVNEAVNSGIVVVVAAGNSGPDEETIGSPGANPNAITVGATYNDIDSSIVSTLQIGEKQFQVLPMLGTEIISDKIMAEIEFGGFGRDQDLKNSDVRGKIVLVERGGETEDEIVFFSEKEQAAASNGAKAIIVFNNEPGIFYGELIHEFIPENYTPSIPAISMTQEDGLMIKEMLNVNTIGTIDVFNHPDFVAMFSSRGPVSPFYEKPDLVAPGVFVETTSLGGQYNITSGTSYAAPHATGAVALLLDKKPELTPHEIKSKLITTSNLVTDPFGNEFSMNTGGAGRINVKNALDSELIILPPSLRFDLSTEKNSETKYIKINSDKLDEKFDIKFSNFTNVNLDYDLQDNLLYVTSKLTSDKIGESEGRLFIKHNEIVHQIPIHIRVSEATVKITKDNGELFFEIIKPFEWTYAKISAINKETLEKRSISFSPNNIIPLKIYQSGDYWIEVKISTHEKIFDVFDSKIIDSSLENKMSMFSVLENIERPVIILTIIIIIVGVFGTRILRN